MKKIILDTNFLLIPAELNHDIYEEIRMLMDEPYELCVLEESLEELQDLMKKGTGKEKDNARLAKQLLLHKKVEIIREGKEKSLYRKPNSKDLSVDDIIVAISGPETIVATQDKELKERLFEKGAHVIILRNKKKLERK